MSLPLTLFNGLNLFLPFRGCFGLRRAWLRSAGVTIGRGVRIATGAKFYDRHVEIGDETWVGPEVTIASTRSGRVRIGARVDIAPATLIVAGTHRLGDASRRAGPGGGDEICIGDGTWIGARSTIIAGARIGAGSMVAAGSVVIAGEYPDNALLAGVPAQCKRLLTESPDR